MDSKKPEPKPRTSKPRRANGRFARTSKDVDQHLEAVRMRGRGATFRQIAEQFGVSVSTAHAMVETAYGEIVQESAAVALALELERLDNDLKTLNDVQALLESGMRPGSGDDEEPSLSLPVGTVALVRLIEAKQKIGTRRDRLLGLGIQAGIPGPTETVSREEILALIDAGQRAQQDAKAGRRAAR